MLKKRIDYDTHRSMVALQLLIIGLIAASIYIFISTGFTLTYITSKFVHFGHGGVIVIATYLLYFFFSTLALPIWVAIPLVLLSAGLVGVLMDVLVYSPLRKKNSSTSILLIAGIGLFILGQNLMQLIFGPNVLSVALPRLQRTMEWHGVWFQPLHFVLFISAMITVTILVLFLRYHNFGKKMIAVADHPELAAISGISVNAVRRWAFFLGSILGGIGGIFWAFEYTIEPIIALKLAITSFVCAMTGGVAKIWGAVLGSVLLGMIDVIVVWYLSPGYEIAVSFSILLIFLIFRPQGILGLHARGSKEV